MTTLRVVVEPLVAQGPAGIGRYTEELTRELIATAPDGCGVEGIVAAHAPEKYDDLTARLPGLVGLHKASLRRRELVRALQYGMGNPLGGGMIHSPSLLAPLQRHDRLNDAEQTTVTIHDVLAWTHPASLRPHDVQWHKAMTKRARKYADAVVVPTHAVAGQLAELFDFGDRIRVIGGAPASALQIPADADARAVELELPERYLLTMGTIEPRTGIRSLIAALSRPELQDLPLLIAGPERLGEESASGVAAAAGLAEGRVRALGFLSDDDLAVVLDRAAVFVYPSLAVGFGLPVVEAFRFGTPVVHSDDPALVEVGGGAGIVVERGEPAGYSGRLAEAIGSVLADSDLAARLSIYGTDRARAFSWRDSAERVWQLHADL